MKSPMYQKLSGKLGNQANCNNVFSVLMLASAAEDQSNVAVAKQTKNRTVSLPEAAAMINPLHLQAFLTTQVLDDYWSLPEMHLLEFTNYFDTALSQVSLSWVKLFKESPLSTLIDFPLSHIPQPVYKTSMDWIDQRPIRILYGFVLFAFDCILTDLAPQHTSSKSQVPTFIALAMVLRSKPFFLAKLLPMLRERPMYQGEDKLPVIVWMIAQASQGDLPTDLYSWGHNLLPLVGNKKCYNTQSMDLILQFVENILSDPKARTILLNKDVRKGERHIPPSSFEILVRLTFPPSSSRVKATERFEAIYPLLKEVALAPESAKKGNAMKQIFTFSLKLVGEGNPVLAKEATSIAICSLTENIDCFKEWDFLYKENLEASVALLKKLVDKLKKDHSFKISLSPSDTLTLNRTMKSFRLKNRKGVMTEEEANCSLYKEGDKYCKVILGRLSHGIGDLILTIVTIVVIATATVFLFYICNNI